MSQSPLVSKGRPANEVIESNVQDFLGQASNNGSSVNNYNDSADMQSYTMPQSHVGAARQQIPNGQEMPTSSTRNVLKRTKHVKQELAPPGQSNGPDPEPGVQVSVTRGKNVSKFFKNIGNALNTPQTYPSQGSEFAYGPEPTQPTYSHEEQQSGKKSDKYKRQIQELQEQNDELRRTLDDKDTTILQLKKNADQLLRTLDNKESSVGPQAQDEYIRSRFKQLLAAIHKWTEPFYGPIHPPPIHADGRLAEPVSRLAVVAPDLLRTDLLSDPKKRRRIVNGWVMQCLFEDLFRLPFKWFPPEHSGSFSSLTEIFMDQALHAETRLEGRVHDWRALGGYLMSELYTDAAFEKHVLDFSHYMIERIMEAVGKMLEPAQQEKARAMLWPVLRDALRFAQLLGRQRAAWTVRFTEAGLSSQRGPSNIFVHAYMDDPEAEIETEDLSQGRVVSIFVSPGLYKRGNTDGEMYERESCVDKAVVITRQV